MSTRYVRSARSGSRRAARRAGAKDAAAATTMTMTDTPAYVIPSCGVIPYSSVPIERVNASDPRNPATSPTPDGRWMAYSMDHGSGVDIWVQPVPPTSVKW